MSETDLRLLIVDDSALYRQAITAAVGEIPHVQIVGIARDGVDAIEKIQALQPDVLTLDVEMPNRNGIETLREMNRLKLAARAIMVSSLTKTGAQVTLDALYEGAFDFIAKPASGLVQGRQELVTALTEKLNAFRTHHKRVDTPPPARQNTRVPIQSPSSGQPDSGHLSLGQPSATTAASSGCEMVVIGASTGGPKALRFVLPRFDREFPVPIVVVQHMPADYTTMMANRMNEECELPVHEVTEGQSIVAGAIYLAPGGKHFGFKTHAGRMVAHLTEDPPENSCRPAVDFTLRSAVEVCSEPLLAVIMTGMGKDGMRGCQAVKQKHGTVFTQDAHSSAVFGMPKAVVDAGCSDRELPLGKIAAATTRHVHRRRRAT